ncbi:MAG: hypothetical protein OXK80_04140 [Bdellovibrionales bacterium]|nr:hypothetical protein [Bdellovibrionales bacterium]
MFNLKQLGFFSVLFLLLACGGNTPYRRSGVGTLHGPYGNIGMGGGRGSASLVSDEMSNVRGMTMYISGTGGQSALTYNGPAQFQGQITFKNVYGSQYSNIHPALPHVPPTSHSSYHGTQCSTGGAVQFNCQGHITNGGPGTTQGGQFTCQANIVPGGMHRIDGILGGKRINSQDYEIIGVQVIGPCTTPRF